MKTLAITVAAALAMMGCVTQQEKDSMTPQELAVYEAKVDVNKAKAKKYATNTLYVAAVVLSAGAAAQNRNRYHYQPKVTYTSSRDFRTGGTAWTGSDGSRMVCSKSFYGGGAVCQ